MSSLFTRDAPVRELGFPGFLLVYIDRAGNALGIYVACVQTSSSATKEIGDVCTQASIYGITAHVDYPNKTDCKDANVPKRRNYQEC